jgi:hypothetical protein
VLLLDHHPVIFFYFEMPKKNTSQPEHLGHFEIEKNNRMMMSEFGRNPPHHSTV